MNDSQDGLSPVARAYRAAGPWLSAVWQFTGSAVVGVGLGYGADAKFATKPIGLVVGGVLGSALGFFAFIRATTRLMNEQSQASKSAQKRDEPK